ncbi:MAG: DJ-1/PfpI family protein [Bacteroidota bacterium]
MRDTVYYFIFNGLSDWEAALALAEINTSKAYTVQTVALSSGPVITAAGLRLTPDLVLSELNEARAAAFIVPGGPLWEEGGGRPVDGTVVRLAEAGVLTAFICGGTLVAARAGLVSNRRFTSNMPGYVELFVPDFDPGDRYVLDDFAVTDRRVVTASAVGQVEFARDVLRELGIYDEPGLQEWFALFKHGTVPARYTS